MPPIHQHRTEQRKRKAATPNGPRQEFPLLRLLESLRVSDNDARLDGALREVACNLAAQSVWFALLVPDLESAGVVRWQVAHRWGATIRQAQEETQYWQVPVAAGRSARLFPAQGRVEEAPVASEGLAGATEVWCPLISRGVVVGAVGLQRPQDHLFSEYDSGMLRAINAALSLLAEQQLAERSWREQRKRSEAVHAQLLNYAVDLRSLVGREQKHTQAARRHVEQLNAAYKATITALAAAVEAKDSYTGGHLYRVQAYGMLLAEYVDHATAQLPGLPAAFLLHDLGKIGVPDVILNKTSGLAEQEWEAMRQHPSIGLRILDGVPTAQVIRDVVGCHHEQWGGGGYPSRLRGVEIPIAARIFAVVDALDAMTSSRSYRAAMPMEAALERIEKQAGQQFWSEAVAGLRHLDPDELHVIQASSQHSAASTAFGQVGQSST